MSRLCMLPSPCTVHWIEVCMLTPSKRKTLPPRFGTCCPSHRMVTCAASAARVLPDTLDLALPFESVQSSHCVEPPTYRNVREVGRALLLPLRLRRVLHTSQRSPTGQSDGSS